MADDQLESLGTSKTPIESLAERFECPIMLTVMEDPVIAADGHTYERVAIQGWIDGGRGTSPLTGERLAHFELTPNHAMRALITDYEALQPRMRRRELNEVNIRAAIALREQDLEELMAKHEKRLTEVRLEKEEIQRQMGPLERRNAELTGKVATYEVDIDELIQQREEAHQRANELEQEVLILNQKQAELEAHLAAQSENLEITIVERDEALAEIELLERKLKPGDLTSEQHLSEDEAGSISPGDLVEADHGGSTCPDDPHADIGDSSVSDAGETHEQPQEARQLFYAGPEGFFSSRSDLYDAARYGEYDAATIRLARRHGCYFDD